MARRTVDESIWRARKALLGIQDNVSAMLDRCDPHKAERDEPDECREFLGEYEWPTPAWLDHLCIELGRVNAMLHAAEGDAIVERRRREEEVA